MPEHFNEHMALYRPAIIDTFDAATQTAIDSEGNEWVVQDWFSDENVPHGGLTPVPFDDPSFETEWAKVYFVSMTHRGLWTMHRLKG